ncbi:hypothetical protein BASA81_015180 [Batrachochytrium salamandrivorans]|nr:hypothetical protein BASA81_015180 [Batrachochytrium salamandrivorans]
MDVFQFLTPSREPKLFALDLPRVGRISLRLRLIGLSVAAVDFVSPDGDRVLDIPQGITATYGASFLSQATVPLRPRQQAFRFSYEGRVTILYENSVLLSIRPVAQVSVEINEEFKPKKAALHPVRLIVKNDVQEKKQQIVVIRTILDVVHASHRITVHALQFLKLYLLSCFENGVKLPLVTEHLVVSIMNVLCEESERQESERQESGHQETRGRRCNPATLTLKQKLLEFHREHYKLTMTDPKEKLGFTNKAQLLHRRGCGQGL